MSHLEKTVVDRYKRQSSVVRDITASPPAIARSHSGHARSLHAVASKRRTQITNGNSRTAMSRDHNIVTSSPSSQSSARGLRERSPSIEMLREGSTRNASPFIVRDANATKYDSAFTKLKEYIGIHAHVTSHPSRLSAAMSPGNESAKVVPKKRGQGFRLTGPRKRHKQPVEEVFLLSRYQSYC